MAMFRQETRAAIRRRIGYLLLGNEFVYGPLTAVTPNTATLPRAARFPANTFVGRVAHFLGNGEALKVDASEEGTGMLTLVPAFTVEPAVGTYAEIWTEQYGPDQINEAINAALIDTSDMVPIRAYAQLPDSALDGSRLTLTLPADWTHLSSIGWSLNGLSERATLVQNRSIFDPYALHPQVVVEGRSIVFNVAVPSSITELSVTGYRLPALLEVDTDLAEVRSDYIMYKAMSLLQMPELGTVSNDPDAHTQRSTGWLGHAENIRQRMKPRFDSNTVQLDLP